MAKRKKSKVVETQEDGTEVHGFENEEGEMSEEQEQSSESDSPAEPTEPVTEESKPVKTPKASKVRGKDMKFNKKLLKGN